MIKFIQGNILESDAEVLVNPVNIEGVMGKGLAFQFKKKFPQNFNNYFENCKNGNIDVGKELNYTIENGKIIVNFPTKRKWKENSKLEYIEQGLEKLKCYIEENNINSIAIPPLGAGNGRLDWNLVKEKIILFCKLLDKKIDIYIYEPTMAELKLSKPHLLLSIFLIEINKNKLKNEVSDLIFQKMIYFYDLFFNKGYFKFVKYEKGPFSKFLNIVYEELKIYSRTTKNDLLTIQNELGKKNISESLENEREKIQSIINFYFEIKDFYNVINYKQIEVEDKIELIATLLFLIEDNKEISLEELENKLFTWNKRKNQKFSKDDYDKAILFLIKKSKIKNNIFGNYSLN